MLGNAIPRGIMGWDPVTRPKDLPPSQNCLQINAPKGSFPQECVFHFSSPTRGCQPGPWMCSGNFPPWPCSHSLFGAQLAALGL